MEVTRPGIGAIDHADTISHADCREVGAHHAFVIEEVGIDTLADIGVAANLGGTQPLHQFDMVGAFDIVHGEVGEIDDAAVFGEFEMFGIGNAPEMAVVPFVLAHRYAVAVFLQQVLVGGIAMRALPSAQFHEIAAEFDFSFVEWRAADVAAL